MNTVDVAAHTNPFPGLRPFLEEEKHLFFGRGRQVNAMVNKLADARFLAVVGASGSGKSSLVNCGLRPALHRGLLTSAGTAWRMAQFRPGNDPLAALAKALAQDGILYGRQDNGLPLEEIIDTHLRVSKRGLLEVYRKAPLPNDVNLLVVVDQFEELFRYRTLATAQKADENREEATAFINLLLEVRQQTDYPIYVAITMRSDFLGDCAQFAGLTEAINAGQFLVPRMTRDERRAAIAGPVGVGRVEILHIGEGNGQADIAGPVGEGWAQITPALLTRLVNDVGDKPDQLSILQHALNRTWSRWEHEGAQQGPLNLTHYRAIGTMARALDQHAEKAYGELDTERRQMLCERIFKTLTDKGTDTRGIRRPTTLNTLCALTGASAAEVIDVIDVFRKPSRSFLMPPLHETVDAKTVIDISHESLMRVWERLKTWADEEADSARIYRRLVETATLYQAGHASLWRDPDLQLALDWRERQQPTEAWALLYGGGFEAARAFLDESEALRAHELLLEKKRQRRLRLLLVAVALFAVVATVAAVFAMRSSNEANEQRQIAERAALSDSLARVEAEEQRRIAIAAKDTAITALIFADRQRELADLSAAEADRQRILADTSAAEAERQRILADSSAAEADRQANNLRLNNSRRLALQASTFLESAPQTGPDIALLLSVEAIRNAFTPEAYETQSRALNENPQLNTFFHGHTGTVSSVVFSPDGKHLATGSSDKTIILWDLKTNKALDTLTHTQSIGNLAFNPDGTRLASSNRDYSITLWNVETRRPVSTLTDNKPYPGLLAFSPNGTRLASANSDHDIILWDAATNRLLATLPGHQETIRSVAFSPTGDTLASAGDDGTIRLWNTTTGGSMTTLRGHEGDIMTVAFSPDGTRLASGSKDDTILLWHLDTAAPPDTLRGHHDDVRSVAFSGSYLASGSADQTIRLWPLAQKDSVITFKGHADEVRSVAFSPDGTKLASGSSDGKVILWNVPTGKDTSAKSDTDNALTRLTEPRSVVVAVAFSPDGTTLAASDEYGSVILWDVATRQAQTLVEDSRGRGVAFSPDGTILATGGDEATVVLWDAQTRRPLGQPLTGHRGQVLAVAFSHDGTILASGDDTGTVVLWDAQTRRPLGQPLTGHWADRRLTLAFSPDGKTLAAGSYGATVTLWDIATGQIPYQPLAEYENRIWDAAFSPDGKDLAAGGYTESSGKKSQRTGVIYLLDPPTGDTLKTFRGHEGYVSSVAFSPDGTRLASGSADGSIILWDLQSGDRLQVLGGHYDPVFSLAFSRDGTRLASGGYDESVILWDVDLQARACRIANRNLTQAEWEQYIGTESPYRRTCPDLPAGE